MMSTRVYPHLCEILLFSDGSVMIHWSFSEGEMNCVAEFSKGLWHCEMDVWLASR